MRVDLAADYLLGGGSGSPIWKSKLLLPSDKPAER